MIRRLTVFACAALIAAGACSRSGGNAADTALNTDLSLAAQQNQAQLDSLSAAERAPAPNALAANGTAAATHSSSGEVATVHHRNSSRSSSSSRGSSARSSGSTGSVTTTTTARAPTVVKHTKRDAAIGAGAGAVIGAVTSHNKVKGGLIGAAVGGILGGVIGNNVDKTKKP